MKHARIGFSACFFHADPTRPIFKGKSLLYMEQQLSHWIQSEGAFTYLIPSPSGKGKAPTLEEIIQDLDAVVLQGGSDVSPKHYGETPLKPEWAGDYIRDLYEMAIVKECLRQNKPLLGICRGAQLLNVAMGGSLYQDIQTQVPKALVHRDWDIYDQNFHKVRFEPGSVLASLYPGITGGTINTVHHQAIKAVGRDLKVEATSEADGIIEAVRYQGPSYAVALQWHPEFQDPEVSTLLDSKPVLQEFLRAANEARAKARRS